MRLETRIGVLDRCDVCGRKEHRRRLVRTQVRYLLADGSNYFSYSSYNSALWTCDATDKSTITVDVHGDSSRVGVDADNDPTYVNATQTWGGSGTYRQQTTAVDVSSLTSFTVSAMMGQRLSWSSNIASASDLTVAMGLCDSAGANKALQKTWTGVNAMQRLWFTMNVADIAAPLVSTGIYVYFTVTVTGTNYWFIDDISLEADVTKPTQFLTTSGTAITSQSATKVMAVRKVCKRCRERLLRESEYPSGAPWIEPPINVDVQEV